MVPEPREGLALCAFVCPNAKARTMNKKAAGAVFLAAALTGLLPMSTPVGAQALRSDSTRTLRATRVAGELRIDGDLADPFWNGASAAGGFVQRQPNSGAPATERTEVRVLYSEEALYVAVRLYDSRPDSIAAPLTRRDARGIQSDWATVMVDSYNDNRTAFAFGVNPRGVKRDYLIYNDAQEDFSWDAVWEVATRVDSLGWTAEFRIPLSQLRFSPQRTTWGLNLERQIARRDEVSYWAAVPPNAPRLVSSFGDLAGLTGLRSPGRLEVQPYAVARLTRAPGNPKDPFHEANELSSSLGADLKYGITSDLTLTATFNPDFGQVEADPSEVNLSAFESFFEERRPFFAEGTDLFQFGLGRVGLFGSEQLFYSRRIGRAPQRGLDVHGFTDAPEATTILGAAKLSGKTADGWSVGVLDAVTAPERARVFTAGADTTLAIEPLTNYAVARASRDFREGQSAVGAVMTSVHRRVDEGSGLDFLHSAAYAGGLDARHRFGGGDYEVSGWVLGSHVEGSRRALVRTQQSPARFLQRPDLANCALCLRIDTTRTSLTGAGANLQVTKIGGHVVGGVMATARTPGFEVNDIGFQQIADAASVVAGGEYNRYEPGPIFRNWRLGTGIFSTWSFGGEQTLSLAEVHGAFQLRNFWSGYADVARLPAVLDPVALRGGPSLRTGGRTVSSVQLSGDPRKSLTWGLGGFLLMEDEAGGRTWSAGPSLRLRPSARAELTFGPTLTRNVTPWQFISREDDGGTARFVGGRLEQTTLAVSARLNYAFTPDLSLQFYAQPFVSAGDFSDFREVADPRARSFERRFRDIAAPFDPDFNVQQLRSNAVLRWEYRPGSTLFLVWSQGREQVLPEGTFGLGRDFGRLFGFDNDFAAPVTNVLLLKVSYWFGR